jgi:tryptophan-rich sensory protein
LTALAEEEEGSHRTDMSTPTSHSPASPTSAWAHGLIATVPVIAASVIGSAVTVPQIPGWYSTLIKPPFNPPNWLFAPVWTVLFAMMALGVYRVLRTPVGSSKRATALTVYHVQLALNLLWSCAFFGLNSAAAGLFVIIPLLGLILVTILLFRPLDWLASALLWPYLAWVSFAALLNFSIWWLNR